MIAFIEEHRDTIGVEPICRHLPIAPSTFYDHMAKRANPDLLSDRAKRDKALRPEIERVWEQNYKVYGVRKVWHQMRREGFDVARCTVARLMKDLGLEGIIRGKKHRTTIPDKSQPCPLDKVNRQFKAPAPNMLWVSDFTYVATWQGFVHVAFVIDAFARRIVGWRVSRTAHAGFVLDALEQAVHQRQPGSGLVHHSDRGSPNTCQFATLNGWLKQVSNLLWAASGIRMTMPWPKRSMACSRPRSFIAAAHGAASTPWNTPHSNASTGSTIAACWNLSETSRRQRPKQTTTQLWKLRPWPRNLKQPASGKHGAVHSLRDHTCNCAHNLAELELDWPTERKSPRNLAGQDRSSVHRQCR